MANKRILVFKDQIESLCRKGRKYRVIGARGGLVIVEEAPEEADEVSVEMELERW